MQISMIEEADWVYILDIQKECYGSIQNESLCVLKSKKNISPSTCFVCRDSNGIPISYLLSHPWYGNHVPSLGVEINTLESSEWLYLHDLAVSKNYIGKNVGTEMVNHLFAIAKNLSYKEIYLTSVQGSEKFWFSKGYRRTNFINICSSYQTEAVVMRRPL